MTRDELDKALDELRKRRDQEEARHKAEMKEIHDTEAMLWWTCLEKVRKIEDDLMKRGEEIVYIEISPDINLLDEDWNKTIIGLLYDAAMDVKDGCCLLHRNPFGIVADNAGRPYRAESAGSLEEVGLVTLKFLLAMRISYYNNIPYWDQRAAIHYIENFLYLEKIRRISA
ncbi:MAG: hypothetical protein WC471_03575 [Candidatus Woesearchaeota archaeon]